MENVLLQATGVSKLFERSDGRKIQVLDAVSFEIYAQDKIAIIGKSGAGKSTFLHLLGTLESPTSGTILFEGKNIFQFNETSLSRFRNQRLGFVFQFHYLMLEFTALENVMMPALLAGSSIRESTERAEALLVKVGLKDRLDHKPNQMSGGEQQRVAIARSLMNHPKLLLTDEMTGNLDPVTGMQIFELIQSLHEEYQMALVSVTHDSKLASTYSKVFSLQEGKLHSVKL